MSSPLLPFTGGLRNQAAEIIGILSHYGAGYANDRFFCDPFFGGGSISHTAKLQGYRVSSNDLALRSYFPASALIVNDVAFGPEVVSRLLAPQPDLQDDFLDNERLRAVISDDILRFSRRVWHNCQSEAERYLAMRVFLAVVPQGAFGLLKKTDTSATALTIFAKIERLLSEPAALVDKLRKDVNNGILSNGRFNEAFARDAVEHIADCNARGALVAHIDPPTYGTKQYDNRYWWLDWFVGDKVDEGGRGFTKAEAVDFSRACVQAANDIPVVAITQQEVAYDKKVAFELLEEAGRKTHGFLLKSNTSNPFFIIVGVR